MMPFVQELFLYCPKSWKEMIASGFSDLESNSPRVVIEEDELT
jgi:hypothetical protein